MIQPPPQNHDWFSSVDPYGQSGDSVPERLVPAFGAVPARPRRLPSTRAGRADEFEHITELTSHIENLLKEYRVRIVP
jgi:hypothetical protein